MSRLEEINKRLHDLLPTTEYKIHDYQLESFKWASNYQSDVQYLKSKLEQVEKALELIANNGDDRPDAYYVLNMVDNALEQLRKD